MSEMKMPGIYVGPQSAPALVEAVIGAGATIVELTEADAIVWKGPVEEFPAELPASVRWVQLPLAGVEQWLSSGVIAAHPDVVWTSAAGAYSHSVAEHALLLLLAGVRLLPRQTAATSWDHSHFTWRVGTLRGSTVAIVGCGGIGRALIPMLAAVGAKTIAVTRSGSPVPGAERTYATDELDEVWGQADHVVLGAPATSHTQHLVGAPELAKLKSTAWIVNIARGGLIDTGALVEALRTNSIGGAALDVTDPEPLPDGHPLWTLPNAIITPHVANPDVLAASELAVHVSRNVINFIANKPLLAPIDPQLGY
jgi:D-3-phosphoglycerate dehydrogenase